MGKRVGFKVLATGTVLVALGIVYRNNGGMVPGADLLTGNGAIVAALGAGLVAAGHRARWGGDAEWRNRALGAALGVSLSAVWRGAVEIAPASGSDPMAWAGTGLATLVLLVPAMFCWAYVAATFLPWRAPEPMALDSKSETRSVRLGAPRPNGLHSRGSTPA